MSDAYKIGDVTVTATGGGWYEISHSSLQAPEKVQGKENADRIATEIAARGADDDGAMAQQGGLDVALAVQPVVPEADELAALKVRLAEEQAARLAAEKRAAALETKTIMTDGGKVPPAAKVSAAVPRKFDGTLDDKAKAELKRLGIETTEIVLEENESIPPTGLYLGHNGRGYVIVPGEQVTVPNFLLGVLNDAVMSAPVVDSKSQKVLGYRNRLRYPYRKVG